MRKSVVKHAWVLLVVLAGGLLFFNSSLVKLSAQQQHNKKRELPVLDYETETAKIASGGGGGGVNKKISARFSGHGNPFGRDRHISELPEASIPLPINDHTLIRLPALPIAESDVIVMGKVTDAQAHLSDDKTGVYSEFPVEVSEVLKDTAKSISIGSTISTTRTGGAVRFASGKVQEYRINRQGMPVSGSQYVLFLKREEAGDFTILTGYELSNGIITPLDGEDTSDPRAALSFAYYSNVAEAQFIQDLRSAIQRGGDKRDTSPL
jgi:hypothetical protein